MLTSPGWNQYIYPFVNSDTLFICFVLTTVHNVFGFWGHLYFYFIDKYGIFEQYKLNPVQKPDPQLVKKAYTQYVIDSFFTLPILSVIIIPYLKTRMSSDLPSVIESIIHIVIGLLSTDFIFYCFHRSLHSKYLYQYIHKQHHEFKIVSSISSEFSHFIESLTNVLSVLIGPALMKSHLLIYVCLIVLRLWESQDAHCGYEFPFYISPWVLLRSNRMHEFHHSHNLGSYGMFFFWDYICGTNTHYYEYELKRKEKLTQLTVLKQSRDTAIKSCDVNQDISLAKHKIS